MFDYLRIVIYNTLFYSFKIGQFIISGFRLLVSLFLLLLKGLKLFVSALSESFSFFSEDISHALQQVAGFLSLIINEFQQLTSVIFYLTEEVLNCFVFIHTFFNDAIQNLLNLMTQGAVHLKIVLVLLGSGVWFVVTFIPIFVYNFGVMLTECIYDMFQRTGAFILKKIINCKLSLRDFYDFVTDVPLESLIGLIVTVSLLYIFTQFYMTIFTCIYQQFSHLSFKLGRLFNHIRQIRIPSINFSHNRIRRFPQVRRSLSSPLPQNKNLSNDDRCCVICQERLKCILLLPCRHVCMCSECNVRFQMYDNSCPICRNHIDDTMRIFV